MNVSYSQEKLGNESMMIEVFGSESIQELFVNESESRNPLSYAFLPSQLDHVYQLGDTEYYLFIPSQILLLSK